MRSREKEVKDIMFTLYDEEEILRHHDKTVAEEAERRGLQKTHVQLGADAGTGYGRAGHRAGRARQVRRDDGITATSLPGG